MVGGDAVVELAGEQARELLALPVNPTPYTLHPTPVTLHPTPCTLHPAPHTVSLLAVLVLSLPLHARPYLSFSLLPEPSRAGAGAAGCAGSPPPP